MPTNIEIKARLRDLEAVRKRAAALADGPARVLRQDDTFFPAASGRLKLRALSEDGAGAPAPGAPAGVGSVRGELIHYERPDAAGPKASRYAIARTDDPDGLRAVLSAALGEAGRVRKTRTLFLAGRTRIHLDEVEGLGSYLELEVVLSDGDAPEDGEREARQLMNRLGVTPDDLVEGAYVDLLRASRRPVAR